MPIPEAVAKEYIRVEKVLRSFFDHFENSFDVISSQCIKVIKILKNEQY